MARSSLFDDMDLPKSNPNEELETLSRRYFELLFPAESFELRSEAKDKGIDYSIELKHKGRNTNIRFLVQLKAHQKTSPNQDGSISHSIRTSNIQYLLGGENLSYYVLFLKDTQTFYYHELGPFIRSLIQKDEDWSKQTNHTLRFTEKLDAQAIQKMYGDTMKTGLFFREIREKLIQSPEMGDGSNRISFDKNLNLTDDSEIKDLIEKYGLDLINDGDWKKVLALHKKATGELIPSTLYHMAIGLAYHYEGQFLSALNHLQKADRKKDNLIKGLKDHLVYFLELTKVYLGFTTPEVFLALLKKLEEQSHIGLYIKIDKARNAFIHSNEPDYEKRYEQMDRAIQQILNHSECTTSIGLIAQSELFYCEGQVNNVLYFQSVANVNHIEQRTGPNLGLRIQVLQRILEKQAKWRDNSLQLLEKIKEADNHFIFHMAQLYYVKVMYEHDLYTRHIRVVQPLPGVPHEPISSKEEILAPLITIMQKVIHFYNHSRFVENLIASMGTLYELFHYVEDFKQANKLMEQLSGLVEENGSLENQKKIEHLKKGGTTHERFAEFVGPDIIQASQSEKEYDNLVRQMKEMDKIEEGKKIESSEVGHIHLFPIGHFSFPLPELQNVLSILRVKGGQPKENISQMVHQEIVPVVNILQEEIPSEGYANGMEEGKGITSWRNVFRIRKMFFEKGFLRVHYP